MNMYRSFSNLDDLSKHEKKLLRSIARPLAIVAGGGGGIPYGI